MLPADLLGEPPHVQQLLEIEQSYVGTVEDPIGSNRGPDIDAWNREFGSPLGSYWCGNYQGHCRKRAKIMMPAVPGSCDEWVHFALTNGIWSPTPVVGAAVIYTNWERLTTGRYAGQCDATHIECVLRVRPAQLHIGGNVNVGGKFTANGYAVALKELEVTRVYGYVLPRPA